jgi:hypothetical protein
MIIMKWEAPKLVDLADRQNALNAVGFSSIMSLDGAEMAGNGADTGMMCVTGSVHSQYCGTGGVAFSLKA